MFNSLNLFTIIATVISLACLVRTQSYTCNVAYKDASCQTSTRKWTCQDCKAFVLRDTTYQKPNALSDPHYLGRLPNLKPNTALSSYEVDPHNANRFVVHPIAYTNDPVKGPSWKDLPAQSVAPSQLQFAVYPCFAIREKSSALMVTVCSVILNTRNVDVHTSVYSHLLYVALSVDTSQAVSNNLQMDL
ncbi:hypothetical protein DFH28DRAFT_921013 [Melampsora americana]|nr:hypothetical protein DFH28DRAFT_921013 [Melampsora americana]